MVGSKATGKAMFISLGVEDNRGLPKRMWEDQPFNQENWTISPNKKEIEPNSKVRDLTK